MLSNFVFDLIAGTSATTRQLRRRVLQLANYDFNVLISGPNGSGKRKLAEAIHRHSQRAGSPFIPVDCAAISGPFFHAQMFGQTATGRLRGRTSTIGCLRSADGGSVLLRNVDRLSLEEQAALAQVLKHRGAEADHKRNGINVRIFATSTRDPDQEVKAGRFRIDLYYLLSTTTVECPSLSERTDDIHSLVSFFLAKSTLEYGAGHKQVSAAAMALLESYDWPGNIGELESAIDTAVRTGKDEPTLDLKHFTEIADRLQPVNLGCEFDVDEHPNGRTSHEVVNGIESVESQPLIANNEPWLTLAEAESLHIRRTLELAEFNATVAATMLGLSISAFRQKLKRHRLQHFLSSEFDKT